MNIKAKFSETSQAIAADMGEIQVVTEYVGGELYDGDYVVTPKVVSQKMETKSKVMSDDVQIKAIPFFETANNSGGDTVYIGTMDE